MQLVLDNKLWREKGCDRFRRGCGGKVSGCIVTSPAAIVFHALGQEAMAKAAAVHTAKKGLGSIIPGEPGKFVDSANEHCRTAQVDVLIHNIGGNAGHQVAGGAVEVALLIGASDLEMEQVPAGLIVRVGENFAAPWA